MAQPGSVTRGFGGRVLIVNEVTEGVFPTNPALQKLSDHVQSVAYSLDPDAQEYRDIGDFDVATFIPGLPSYGLKVTYLLHTDRKSYVDSAMNRLANNGLQSHSIEVAVGLDGANVGYFLFRGAKAESAEVKGEVGKATLVEVSYRCLAVDITSTAPAIGTGSRESAALGAVCRFATSTILRGGTPLGFITRGASLKVTHKLEVEGTDGQAGPKVITEGARSVTGSVDISHDDGGVALATSVLALTESNIVFNCGATGAPSFTATAAIFKNLEGEANTTDGILKKAIPFTAKKVITGTVA